MHLHGEALLPRHRLALAQRHGDALLPGDLVAGRHCEGLAPAPASRSLGTASGDVLADLSRVIPALPMRHLGADRSWLVPALLSRLVSAVAVLVAFLFSDGSALLLRDCIALFIHNSGALLLRDGAALLLDLRTLHRHRLALLLHLVHTLGVQYWRAFILLLVAALLLRLPMALLPWHLWSPEARRQWCTPS
jgi:hypothetical protein